MQQPDVVWQTLNRCFCSYKHKFQTRTFCKNEYNVTGLCNARNCPLANPRYATVREDNGRLFLCVKTAERAHSPARLWQRLRLSGDYGAALRQIDAQLRYWPRHMRNKCKMRLTRLTQVLIRAQRIAARPARTLVRVHQKVERRERVRAKKAEAAAMLDQQIKKELYARLLKGTYPTEVVDLDHGLHRLLHAPQEELEEQQAEREMEQEVDMDDAAEVEPIRFVAAGDDDEDEDEEGDAGATMDIEDFVAPVAARKKRGAASAAAAARRAAKRGRVEIEYEEERIDQTQQSASTSS